MEQRQRIMYIQIQCFIFISLGIRHCFNVLKRKKNAKKLNKVFPYAEERESEKPKSVVWIFAVAEVVGKLT